MPVVIGGDNVPDIEEALIKLEETRLARIALEVLDTRMPSDLATAELTEQLLALRRRLAEKELEMLQAVIIVPFRNGHVSTDILAALQTLAANGLTIRLI
jgi:hypothetical protein